MLAAALIVLAACSSGDADQADQPPGQQTEQAPEPADEAGEELPEVAPEFDGDPAIAFPDSGPPEDLQVEVLTEGDGPLVEEGAAVLAHYAGHVWDSAEPFDSSFDRGEPTLFSLAGVIDGWSQGIPGHEVGSRLLISIPPALGYGPSGGTPDGRIGPDDTIVFVVDVIDAVNPADAGDADAAVQADAESLPVTLDADPGEPVMPTVREDAEAPEQPDVEVIAEGDGEPARPGGSVVVAYSIVTWSNSERESTWPQFEGTRPIPEVGQVGAGQWYDLLADIPSGSRVLITLPGGDSGEGVAIIADLILTQQG